MIIYNNNWSCIIHLHKYIRHRNIRQWDIWHRDIRHRDIRHRDIRHRDIRHRDIRHKDIRHKDIRHLDIRHMDRSVVPMYHIHLTLARTRLWGRSGGVAPLGEALDGGCGGRSPPPMMRVSSEVRHGPGGIAGTPKKGDGPGGKSGPWGEGWEGEELLTRPMTPQEGPAD